MIAALELQRDAGLMASDFTVLSQYVMVLHRMSSEVFQSLLGQEELPTGASNGASAQMAAMGLGVPRLTWLVLNRFIFTATWTAWAVRAVLCSRPVSSRQSRAKYTFVLRFQVGLTWLPVDRVFMLLDYSECIWTFVLMTSE